MFSHNAADNPYWQKPKWYNRDRPLFKKYIPLIRRVAEAGWQPVTNGESDNTSIFVERFGLGQTGALFFTLCNGTSAKQRGQLVIDWPALGTSDAVTGRELISDKPLKGPGPWLIELEPQTTLVIEVNRTR